MVEIPANLTPVAYLRNDDLEKFELVEFLQYFNIEDNTSAASFFKDVIKTILDFSKKSKKKKSNEKLVKFAKAMKKSKYSILNSTEVNIYYIQRRQDRTSLNRELSFANSAANISEAITNGRKRPVKIKIVCEESNDSSNEESESSRKKRKFEECDGVFVEGLIESLGTKIGNDARLLNATNTKKEIYFKMCGMNGVIDLTDVMPGSQLHDLSEVSKDKIIKNLTEKAYVINSAMENEDFAAIVKKAAEPGVNLYQYIQELDETKCRQDMYGSKSMYSLVLYNIFSPMPIHRFSEADYIVNIWAPLLKYTFCKTCLWPHWGDTVPIHLSNTSIYIKLDFRLLDNVLNNHDWATGDAGINVVDWKYFTDKTKLVLTTKSQLNELLKLYHVNCHSVSRIKIPFIHIIGLNAVVCYMELHQNGLYKVIQVISFDYPITKNCVKLGKLENLIKGLSAFRGLSLDLFEFISDMERSSKIKGKNKMNRSTAAINTVDDMDDNVSSWSRDLWFPPSFMNE